MKVLFDFLIGLASNCLFPNMYYFHIFIIGIVSCCIVDMWVVIPKYFLYL